MDREANMTSLLGALCSPVDSQTSISGVIWEVGVGRLSSRLSLFPRDGEYDQPDSLGAEPGTLCSHSLLPFQPVLLNRFSCRGI